MPFLHPSSSFHLNTLKFHIFPGHPCLLCFIGIQHSMAGSEVIQPVAGCCTVGQIRCMSCDEASIP